MADTWHTAAALREVINHGMTVTAAEMAIAVRAIELRGDEGALDLRLSGYGCWSGSMFPKSWTTAHWDLLWTVWCRRCVNGSRPKLPRRVGRGEAACPQGRM